MNNIKNFDVGDIIKMKKPHPCGSSEWEILRVGADFRLKCLGCGHQVMVSRKLVEKNTREIRKKACNQKINMIQYEIVIYYLFLVPGMGSGARDHKEVQDMSKYELAVVVSAKLEDEARAEVIEKVNALVTRFGGNVTEVEEWGKKKLAYEIQKMKEGFYYFVKFESDTTTPIEVEQRIRIMDGVIRYLCVKQEAQKEAAYE